MPFRYATVRYLTEPERVERMLPPGLVPGERPEVFVDFLVIDFGEARSVFFPTPYHECAVWVRCRLETAASDQQDGYFLLAMPLSGDWGRSTGREFLALSKKDASVELGAEDGRVTAVLRRRNRELLRLEGEVAGEPTAPANWLREVRDGGYGLRFRLEPDWRKGLVRGGGELVRITSGAVIPPPEEPDAGEPRDLRDLRVTLPQASPLDPVAELPVVEVLGGAWFANEGFEYSFGSGRPTERTTEREVLRTYSPAEIEPWALWGYDRPVTAGSVWTPPGWPERTTAVRLTRDEVARYRAREALEIPATAASVTLAPPPDVARAVLPPGVLPAQSMAARILAVRSPGGDVSSCAFDEVWLLAACRIEGRDAWYALSHVVSDGGDVMYGREVLGYPSRHGEVAITDEGGLLRVTGDRVLRRFLDLTVDGGGEPGEERVEDLVVIGVQADSFNAGGLSGRLVAQTWLVVGRWADVTPDAVSLVLPDGPGPANVGRPDPWFELAGPVTAAGRGNVVVRRGPGEVLTDLDDVWSLYRERFDGSASIARITQKPARPSFRLDLDGGS